MFIIWHFASLLRAIDSARGHHVAIMPSYNKPIRGVASPTPNPLLFSTGLGTSHGGIMFFLFFVVISVRVFVGLCNQKFHIYRGWIT